MTRTRQDRYQRRNSASKSFRDTSSMIQRYSKSKGDNKKKGFTLKKSDGYHPENIHFEPYEINYYISSLIDKNASSKNMLDYLNLLNSHNIDSDSNLHRLFSKEKLEKVESVVPRDYKSRDRLRKRIDASKMKIINEEFDTKARSEGVSKIIVGRTGTGAGIKNKTRKRINKTRKRINKKGIKSRRRNV